MRNAFYGAIAVFMVVVLSSCSSDSNTATEPNGKSAEITASSNFEWIVEYTGKTQDAIDAIKARGGVVIDQLDEVDVILAGNLGMDQARDLEAEPFIKMVLANEMMQFVPSPQDMFGLEAIDGPTVGVHNINPSDAFFYDLYQWDMKRINVADAWHHATGDGIRVGILDTGGSPTHLDLAGKYDEPACRNFTSPNPADWEDRHFHGTHVAGTVSTNNIGIAGVAPDVTLVAVKVLGDGGSGSFFWIIQGILYASDPDGGNCDVINMSLSGAGTKEQSGKFLSLIYRATQTANQRGCLVVCAAGNARHDMDHDGNYITVPAQSGNAMAVSATGPLGQVNPTTFSCYSNYGTSAISVAAPGGNFVCGSGYITPHDGVLSCLAPAHPLAGGATNKYVWASGTSMAAPHVAGAAALVAESGGQPGAWRSRIERTAEDLGKKGADPQYGKGFLDAAAAVR